MTEIGLRLEAHYNGPKIIKGFLKKSKSSNSIGRLFGCFNERYFTLDLTTLRWSYIDDVMMPLKNVKYIKLEEITSIKISPYTGGGPMWKYSFNAQTNKRNFLFLCADCALYNQLLYAFSHIYNLGLKKYLYILLDPIQQPAFIPIIEPPKEQIMQAKINEPPVLVNKEPEPNIDPYAQQNKPSVTKLPEDSNSIDTRIPTQQVKDNIESTDLASNSIQMQRNDNKIEMKPQKVIGIQKNNTEIDKEDIKNIENLSLAESTTTYTSTNKIKQDITIETEDKISYGTMSESPKRGNPIKMDKTFEINLVAGNNKNISGIDNQYYPKTQNQNIQGSNLLDQKNQNNNNPTIDQFRMDNQRTEPNEYSEIGYKINPEIELQNDIQQDKNAMFRKSAYGMQQQQQPIDSNNYMMKNSSRTQNINGNQYHNNDDWDADDNNNNNNNFGKSNSEMNNTYSSNTYNVYNNNDNRGYNSSINNKSYQTSFKGYQEVTINNQKSDLQNSKRITPTNYQASYMQKNTYNPTGDSYNNNQPYSNYNMTPSNQNSNYSTGFRSISNPTGYNSTNNSNSNYYNPTSLPSNQINSNVDNNPSKATNNYDDWDDDIKGEYMG